MSKLRRREFFGTLGGLTASAAVGKNIGTKIFQLSKRGEPSPASVMVLGTAQDGGFPHIGCYCPNCTGARINPSKSRSIASLALLDHIEKKAFLIDCTPDIRAQYDRVRNRLKITQSRRCVPDGILLSHAHIGHYTGLIFYGYEALSASGLPVYASDSMAAFLENNGPWSQLISQENILIHSLAPSRPIELTGHLAVTAFPVPHRHEYSDTMGFKVEGKTGTLLYIPDIQNWEIWDRDIAAMCLETDYALLDGTFFSPDELPGRDISSIGHPFMANTMEKLKEAANSVRILFTHINHSNPALADNGDALRQIQKKGFHVAQEGEEFFI